MDKKRLAIQFFWHTRTYKKTYENFFKYIVEPNQQDGWEIDIFIHTWDMSSSSSGSWHEGQDLFDIYPLSQSDIDDIKQIYNPKAILNIFNNCQNLNSKAKNIYTDDKTSFIEFILILNDKHLEGVDIIERNENYKISALRAYLYEEVANG